MDSTNADALYVRGLCLYYEDCIDKAVQFFVQALRMAPDHDKARLACRVSNAAHKSFLNKLKSSANGQKLTITLDFAVMVVFKVVLCIFFPECQSTKSQKGGGEQSVQGGKL